MKMREIINLIESAEQNSVYYHVTFASRVSKIMKDGLVCGKKRNWNNTFGGKLGSTKYIYLFTKPEDAGRWAFKMEYDFGKPTVILVIRSNIKVEPDTVMGVHSQSAVKTSESIPPSDIIKVTKLTQEMKQALVKQEPIDLIS